MKERNHTCVSYAGLALHEDKKWNHMLQRFMRERNPISVQFAMPASLPNTIWHVTLHLLMKKRNPTSVCSVVTVFQEKRIWKLMSYQFIKQLWHMTCYIASAHEKKKPYKITSVCSAVTVFQWKKIWKLMSYQFIEQLWGMTCHIASAHEKKKPYKCMQCSDSFSRKENLETHVISVYWTIMTYVTYDVSHCVRSWKEESLQAGFMQCSDSFPWKENLETHVVSVHWTIFMTCHIWSAHENKKPLKCAKKSGWFNQTIFYLYFKMFYPEINKWIKTWDMSKKLKIWQYVVCLHLFFRKWQSLGVNTKETYTYDVIFQTALGRSARWRHQV
jgi:hypothetical protein